MSNLRCQVFDTDRLTCYPWQRFVAVLFLSVF